MLKTLVEQVYEHTLKYPSKTALICGNTNVSYYELYQKVLAAYSLLKSEGFVPGDVILVAARKQPGFVYVYLAAHLAGITIVPLDPETNETRFSYIVSKVSPKLFIGFNGDVTPMLNKSFNQFETLNPESIPIEPFEWPSLQDVAEMLFTTGTTGDPKGVMLTHRNIAAAIRNINKFIGNTAEDVELLALPVGHIFGLGRLRCVLSSGGTLILYGSFVNIKHLFRVLKKYTVTGLAMAPASWRYIKTFSQLRLSEFSKQLRYIELGSAFLSAEEKKELATVFPTTRVCMNYGLTEASRSAYLEFHNDMQYLNSVGKPCPNVSISIRDEYGKELAYEQEGEICIRGEQVFAGYFNEPTHDIMWDDFFRTGDWGYKDANGYLYMKSRIKDLINVGGKKVSPVEVEKFINKFDGVVESVCNGIDDPNGIMGEVVKAWIVKEKDASLSFDDIAKYLASCLEDYKVPVEYAWIKCVPKTTSGKIQRKLLN